MSYTIVASGSVKQSGPPACGAIGRELAHWRECPVRRQHSFSISLHLNVTFFEIFFWKVVYEFHFPNYFRIGRDLLLDGLLHDVPQHCE